MAKNTFLLFFSCLVLIVFFFVFQYGNNRLPFKPKKNVEKKLGVNGFVISPRPCNITQRLHHALECFWFHGDEQTKEVVSLPIVVIKSSKNNEYYTDPLVYISGGPGEEGNTLSSSVSYWDDWLLRAKISRDFLLVDLRGSKQARPSLQCNKYNTLSKKLIKQNLTFAQEYERLNPVINHCLLQMKDSFNNGLYGFSSVTNAQDLGNLLRGLGYQSWNYLGVSYGSRVAIVAALTQPEVNKIILDSPYPLGQGKLSDTPILWHRALSRFLNESGMGFNSKYLGVLKQLKAQAIEVKVEDWSTGLQVDWVLNDQRLISVIYSALYRSEARQSIVDLVMDLSEMGAPQDLFILEYFYNQIFDGGFNAMLYFATECNDNPLTEKDEFERSLVQVGELAPLFSDDLKWDICRNPLFKVGQLPQMRPIDIPVLTAVGELDPITTEQHAQNLMSWLSHGVTVLLENTGHAEYYSSDCGLDFIAYFLASKEGGIVEGWTVDKKKLNNCGHFNTLKRQSPVIY